MNYIGSKYSLLAEIRTVLDEHSVSRKGFAFDVFAGTGAVAQMLKQRGHTVFANDWQYYSYIINYAYIGWNTFPLFEVLLNNSEWKEIINNVPFLAPIFTFSNNERYFLSDDVPCVQVLNYLNNLSGIDGDFYHTYCEGGRSGRMYFSCENGRRIQAIRDTIKLWFENQLISSQEQNWLLGCLLESADRVANTASVYGAYLKHVKKTARKPLTLVALHPTPSTISPQQHRVFCEDSTVLVKYLQSVQFELVYADPPYNQRQYSSNYHILETIARWDLNTFEPRGVTGLRHREDQKSDFCARSKVADALSDLMAHVNCSFFLLSYNNEGLLTEQELEAAFREHFITYTITKIPFKRFRADNDHHKRSYKTNSTNEFLVMGKTKKRLHIFLPSREMVIASQKKS